jgi:8-oxo-dGTP pyrophosphatase MutT (NUDIX family)
MYKVFINHKAVFLYGQPGNINNNIDNQYIKCENSNQINVELIKFLSNPDSSRLFLYNPESAEKLFSLFISLFLYIEAAGGLVKDPTGRLLFIHRLGMWDLPKGKTKKGESAPEAALREVEEETGLQHLTILRTLPSTYHVYERKGKQYLKRTHWFEMQSACDGPLLPQADEDITDARWFGPTELSMPISHTYPAIADLVEDYIASTLLFH